MIITERLPMLLPPRLEMIPLSQAIGVSPVPLLGLQSRRRPSGANRGCGAVCCRCCCCWRGLGRRLVWRSPHRRCQRQHGPDRPRPVQWRSGRCRSGRWRRRTWRPPEPSGGGGGGGNGGGLGGRVEGGFRGNHPVGLVAGKKSAVTTGAAGNCSWCGWWWARRWY